MNPIEQVKNWVHRTFTTQTHQPPGPKEQLTEEEEQFILTAWYLKTKQDAIKRRINTRKQIDDFDELARNAFDQHRPD